MAGFLSRLVQRTLAESSTIMPRLAGPYEDSREPAASRAGGSEDSMATLRVARDQVRLWAETSEPAESVSLKASASTSRGSPPKAVPRLHDATMPMHGEDPTSVDRHELPFESQADTVVEAMPPSRVPQNRSAFLGREVSTPLRQQADAQTLEPVEPDHSHSPSVPSRWRAELPPMWSPAGGHSDPMASQIGVRIPLDKGESQSPSTEPFETPRFEQTGQRSEPVAEVDPSKSTIVPSIDPSPTIHTVQPSRGMLVEPPAARPSTSQYTAGNAQLHSPAQPSATPTVHVTIGRIELRAVASAAAPAPSRPAEKRPALSLGDYLERRATVGPR